MDRCGYYLARRAGAITEFTDRRSRGGPTERRGYAASCTTLTPAAGNALSTQSRRTEDGSSTG